MLITNSQDLSLTASVSTSIKDVFSTYVYTATVGTEPIVNNINLTDEGGMVWVKSRDIIFNYGIFDTERGKDYYLSSNTTSDSTYILDICKFYTNGFLPKPTTIFNYTGHNFVSWTFRKAPKFFDVVTYIGDGKSGRLLPHNLNTDVGMVIIKSLDNLEDWAVACRTDDLKIISGLSLNGTGKAGYTVSNSDGFNSSTIDLTYPRSYANRLVSNSMNVNGVTYVAYLFAHNETDGLNDGDSNPVIKCGSFTTDASRRAIIDLGFEPQYLLVRRINSVGSWEIQDYIRGMTVGTSSIRLFAESNQAEEGAEDNLLRITPTGFYSDSGTSYIAPSSDYIYMAIARDTTTKPKTSDEVFAIDTRDTSLPAYDSGFPVDMALSRYIDSARNTEVATRLLQGTYLITNYNTAESTIVKNVFDYNNGWYNSGYTQPTQYSWMWKRAKGFFDVVTYTGNGVAGRQVPHNLGVVPEMIWVKPRNITSNWSCYAEILGNDRAIYLNSNIVPTVSAIFWNNTSPTDTVFSVKNDRATNGNTDTYIAYLFATVSGVSKVGSYTGNGSTISIDAGFTTGTKFLIVKRTNHTGDWIMVDSQRGLDNFVELNTTNAQARNSGISSTTTGFQVVHNITTDLNRTGGEYIYFAIAESL
jgi:hypothetical protein